MTSLQQALRDLGCGELQLQAQVHVAPPEQDSEQLKGEVLLTLAMMVGLVQAQSQDLRAVETQVLPAGLELHTSGQDFEGLSLYGADLSLRASQGAECSRISEDDGDALVFKLDPGGVCLIDAGDLGQLALARPGGGGLDVAMVGVDPPPDWLQHDPEPWLDRLKQDALTQARIGVPLAAGHHLRFHEPPREQLTDILARAIGGDPTPDQTLVSQWLQDQPSGTLDRWDGLSRGIAARALDDLDRLDSELRLDDDDWWAALGELLEDRDDLASLALLLGLGDSAARVTEALIGLDDVLHMFLRALPIEPVVLSERLERAGLREPAAWWTDPAARA